MFVKQRRYFVSAIFIVLLLVCEVAVALRFVPGVGMGLEYTDNVALIADNTDDDLIAVTYVGASVSEDKGFLKYDVTTSFNKQNYTKDSFEDQRYFYLAGRADWEMIKDRFYWTVSNTFNQQTIDVLDPNTPDNLQDSNVFFLGADIRFPLSARQGFNLAPKFSQYYYEQLNTDNKQYALVANWNYQMSRVTNVGLTFSTRTINYFEQVIEDTTFTNAAIIYSSQRSRSSFSMNLGSTNVRRDSGEETSGFSGNANWLATLSSRSTFNTGVVTDLTDSSSVSASDSLIGNDIQVTTDVIRYSAANLTYQRKGTSLQTTVRGEYSKVNYSESPLDQTASAVDALFDYPITRLLSGGTYANYSRIKRLDIDRVDDHYTLGNNLIYRFSRKLHGLFDLKYRKKESTLDTEGFNEFSLYVSLVYGFGEVYRPTRVGGF